jgi:hypothetical protein
LQFWHLRRRRQVAANSSPAPVETLIWPNRLDME